MPEFHQEMVDVNALGYDEAQVERRLQPAA
ncbi:MAG: hypothetical protein JWL59_1964 [Chthoniobacteraceae bacterium]|nr:hypothetical protein [Chthoniobacteraceae bacterium]